MVIKGKVHCLFEQSGTFKKEFIKLGIPAEDYDIQNNFGETDHVIDLFAEIEKEYRGWQSSVFQNITKDDLIIAFFPCIYFSQQNQNFFDGTIYQWQNKSAKYKAYEILQRGRDRQKFYEYALELFTLCDIKGLRLVVENPYDTRHYLYNNFPYKPALIDKNRQRRGDYFVKPTQYWFINSAPTCGYSYQKPKKTKTVNGLTGHVGHLCDEDRSLISSDYARNFICDFILGKEQRYSEQTLF